MNQLLQIDQLSAKRCADGPQGFTVVTPPPGITVGELPPGATPVYIRGTMYYQADGAYFLPAMQNGVAVYTTVQP